MLYDLYCFPSVKLIGKLEDGTIFVKKGHEEEPPFEFKIDEGNII
jgi:FK506-binding protein 4/5